MVSNNYVIVYLCAGGQNEKLPRISWLRECYTTINYRYTATTQSLTTGTQLQVHNFCETSTAVSHHYTIIGCRREVAAEPDTGSRLPALAPCVLREDFKQQLESCFTVFTLVFRLIYLSCCSHVSLCCSDSRGFSAALAPAFTSYRCCM